MNASFLSSAMTTHARNAKQHSRADLIWRVIGVVVIAALLAKWTWVFLAPKDAALPTTAAWKKTADADHLFGDVTATGANSSSSLGNVQLVGVFAHPTAGFAVLTVDGKQVGVGLGELVMAGARLAETQADYVLIERGGVNSRINLSAAKPAAGIAQADAPASNIVNHVSAQREVPALPAPAALANQLSPEQRAAMQQELQHFRRRN